MPIIYRKGLVPTEISGMEVRLKSIIPDDYRDFLLKMNGLYLTSPDFATISLPGVEAAEISFDRLFGLIPSEECNDIVSFNAEFAGELDFLNVVLVIGEDGGGNPFVILGESGGEGVYYWDRTHLHDNDANFHPDIPEQNECGNLFFVSTSFDDFYKKITSSLGGSVQEVLES